MKTIKTIAYEIIINVPTLTMFDFMCDPLNFTRSNPATCNCKITSLKADEKHFVVTEKFKVFGIFPFFSKANETMFINHLDKLIEFEFHTQIGGIRGLRIIEFIDMPNNQCKITDRLQLEGHYFPIKYAKRIAKKNIPLTWNRTKFLVENLAL
jgi:hypothetical protein